MLNNILNGYRPLIIKLGVISLLAFCITFALTPSRAQNTPQQDPKSFELNAKLKCGPTADILKELKETAGEIVVAYGTSDDNDKVFVSIWTNPKSNTWTFILTNSVKPEISCVMHSGQNFKIRIPEQKGQYSI
jgi:hypothetical protein